MKGATLNVLRVQWERSLLEGDFDRVDRIVFARARIEALAPTRQKTERLPQAEPRMIVEPPTDDGDEYEGK